MDDDVVDQLQHYKELPGLFQHIQVHHVQMEVLPSQFEDKETAINKTLLIIIKVVTSVLDSLDPVSLQCIDKSLVGITADELGHLGVEALYLGEDMADDFGLMRGNALIEG